MVLVLVLGMARPATADMARDQLFFVGHDPEPVLLAVVLQRTSEGEGAVIEAKSFLAWRGKWRTPFWERVRVPRWPGRSVAQAIGAWRESRGGSEKLRVRWRSDPKGFELRLRRRSGALILRARGLAPAGGGEDPHGRVTWRSGAGTLTVNGREVQGVVAAESLAEVRAAWPRFGRFEMWLQAPASGGLVLGRTALSGARGEGRALVVGPSGASRVPFAVRVRATRSDAQTGFALPTAWGLERPAAAVLERTGGELGRGEGAGGGPAVYDISLATDSDGKAAALVFHLQDAKGP